MGASAPTSTFGSTFGASASGAPVTFDSLASSSTNKPLFGSSFGASAANQPTGFGSLAAAAATPSTFGSFGQMAAAAPPQGGSLFSSFGSFSLQYLLISLFLTNSLFKMFFLTLAAQPGQGSGGFNSPPAG